MLKIALLFVIFVVEKYVNMIKTNMSSYLALKNKLTISNISRKSSQFDVKAIYLKL